MKAKATLSRTFMRSKLREIYADPKALEESFAGEDLPEDLADWLARLALLAGVPFNYLVPDEAMLPPESIRFFYLDPNWIEALVDGALSIGRSLNSDTNSPQMNLQRAAYPRTQRGVTRMKKSLRPRLFGMQAKLGDIGEKVITGFLLRSSLVIDYPDMGVNIYPEGHTPSDPNPERLEILRYERLGPNSDTLICLVEGDAYRVDIHEAPQALHYGVDCIDADCKVDGQDALAVKNLHTFGIKQNSQTLETGTEVQEIVMSDEAAKTDISSAMRSECRVIEMSTLANIIKDVNQAATPPPGTDPPTSIDSAQMGFEMTEGVGMVSFYKSTES